MKSFLRTALAVLAGSAAASGYASGEAISSRTETISDGTTVSDFRARQDAAWEGLHRRGLSIGHAAAIAVDISEEQARQLANPICETCPTQGQRRQVGVTVPIGRAVSFRGLAASAGPHLVAGGSAEVLAGGEFVWSTRISTPGAPALSLVLRDMDIPEGFSLWVYTDSGAVDGPHTGRGPGGDGRQWTNPLPGSDLYVELRSDGPVRASELEQVSFTMAGAGWFSGGPFGADAGRSGCSQNAACVNSAECYTTADFAHLEELRRATAHIAYEVDGNFFICSGGLVADTDTTTVRHFFLTANHCFATQAAATSCRFFWDYRKPSCDGGCPDSSGFPNQQGATLMYTAGAQDVTFLELTEAPPGTRSYMGFSTEPVANTAGAAMYRVHHPLGSPQSYSVQSVDTAGTTCDGLDRGNYIYSTNTLNATEQGSSGSIVVNANGQIIGQLFGACGSKDPCATAESFTVDGALAAYYPAISGFLGAGSKQTPTPTPTPTPGGDSRTFQFDSGAEGWTSLGLNGSDGTFTFTSPNFAAESGQLVITTTDNVGNFGFWESPQVALGAVTVEEGSAGPLYALSHRLLGDVDPAMAPVVRTRAITPDFQQADVQVITSAGGGELSPSASAREYTLRFNDPAGGGTYLLDFDVLGTDSSDAAVARMSLERSHLERVAADANTLSSGGTGLRSYDFRGADSNGAEFVDLGTSGPIIAPELRAATDEGLRIAGSSGGAVSKTQFGFWNLATDLTLVAGSRYRINATVRSGATPGQEANTPSFRIRANSSNFQFSQYVNIESTGSSTRVPRGGETATYSLWITPPPAVDGNTLLLAFDYIFIPGGGNDPTIGLTLESIEIIGY